MYNVQCALCSSLSAYSWIHLKNLNIRCNSPAGPCVAIELLPKGSILPKNNFKKSSLLFVISLKLQTDFEFHCFMCQHTHIGKESESGLEERTRFESDNISFDTIVAKTSMTLSTMCMNTTAPWLFDLCNSIFCLYLFASFEWHWRKWNSES